MSPINLNELTIRQVHDAYRQGLYTSKDLVSAYIERIQAIDRDESGPALNSITVVNDKALAIAQKLDDDFKTTGAFQGPLHGIPVVVKDHVETEGLVTTFGSVVAKDFVPKEDATLITKLKAAGAIVLAKSCMPDWGTDYFSTSSITGVTRNPYDLDRDPGASSSGTAAAVAANLALIGIGSDSGGSIRIPSTFCNLVGLRPTIGLVSLTGISKGVKGQSTSGPMGRTVKDVALLLDAIVGFDENDPSTALPAMHPPPPGGSYAAGLDRRNVLPARIGVVRFLFGDDSKVEHAAVNQVINSALDKLRAAGYEVVDVEVPGLKGYLASTSMFLTRSRADLDDYLKPKFGITLPEITASGKYPKENVMIPYVSAHGLANPHESGDYGKQVDQLQEFQQVVATTMLKHRVSALAFPTAKQTAPRFADIDQQMRGFFPFNIGFASQLRWPAISVPAGFTAEREGTPQLPVGLEFVAQPFSDKTLLELGLAVEELVKARRTPPL
ncbi:putative amidase family protein [Thozetella sp. PMI_491]|nr:putative amidase family protein [Thozetella sp. PMI_491]